MQYENIFVLSPGRSGSKTFIEASKFLTNYSAAHESLSSKLGKDRFDYPKFHIEADNRLTWFLGALAENFDHKNVLYVHLVRNFEHTVESFLDRLQNSNYRSSIIQAFGYGILMKSVDWKPEEEEQLCRFYVETVHSNISEFLSNREHLRVELENLDSVDTFLNVISAEGDLESFRSTWKKIHNARSTS